jgi:hypothetical protein
VCEGHEARSAQAKSRILQKLRLDFDDKHAALKKELRGRYGREGDVVACMHMHSLIGGFVCVCMNDWLVTLRLRGVCVCVCDVVMVSVG